jgi:hypothetical protein
MTVDLAGEVGGVVGRLKAAGIRATADLRDVNPPCVYVPPPAIAFRFGKGGADLTWTVAAIVPNTGRDVALRNLTPLIAAVTAALAATPVTGGRPIDVTGLDGAAPSPAYELTFTSRSAPERIEPT